MLNEFNADHVAALSNVPDMSQLDKRFKQAGESFGVFPDGRQSAFLAQHLHISQGDRATQRIAGIAMPVEKCFPLAIGTQKPSVDFFRGQGGTEREVASGESFADCHEIWCHVVMVTGKHTPGSSKTSGHFIGNEKNLVLRA